ncbi:CHAT domain-containing protein [Haliangium sp.]|uniref:CHAT domain-containing protein n=1 Tax=Haliangium sp. TaxID=2663208 RepID=UPI003D13B269
MSDEDLLQRLAALAREQADEDEDSTSNPDSAFAPLDDDARARIAARVSQHAAAQQAEAAPDGDGDGADSVAVDTGADAARTEATADEGSAPTVGKVIPFRRRRQRWLAGGTVAVAAAAVATLALWPQAQPLPTYALHVSGGQKSSRSTEAVAERRRMGAGDRLDVVLRPATAVAGPVAARVFLEGPAQTVRELRVTPDIAPEGAIHIEGTTERLLPVPPGSYTLIIAIGRDDALPDAAGVGAAREQPGDAVRLFEVPVERVEDDRVRGDRSRGDRGGRERDDAATLVFAGCGRVFRGGLCERADGAEGATSDTRTELTLWLPDRPQTQVELRLGGDSIEPAVRPVAGGSQLAVELPGAGRALELVTRATDADTTAPVTVAHTIRIVPGPPPALADALTRAETLGKQARAAWRSGDSAGAIAALDEAVAADRAAGCLSCESKDVAAQVFMLVRGKRFADARARLDAAAPALAQTYPPARVELGYSAGLLALERGDMRVALAALEDAAVWSERVGMGEYEAVIRDAQADVMQRLGRYRDAVALQRSVLPTAADAPCERARMLANMAWTAIGADQPLGVDVRAALSEALSIHATSSCGAGRHANTLVNLAALELRDQAPDAAAGYLAQALELVTEPDPWLDVWVLELDARIALARGQTDVALAGFERLARMAEVFGDSALAWRAAVGTAEVFTASASTGPSGARDLDRAAAAYARAEELVDAASMRVPLTSGRETFAALRARASRRHVALLLELGRTDAAFELARRARARVLAGLQRADRVAGLDGDARAAWDQAIAAYQRGRDQLDAAAGTLWRLPGDRLDTALDERKREVERLRGELDRAYAVLSEQLGERDTWSPARARRAPAPGELMVLGFPLDDDWALFAADPDQVTVHRIPEPDPGRSADALATDLLAPIAAQLARARRLTVMPYGPLRAVDVHALPWQGQPLLAQVEVVYGLDLAAPSPAPASSAAAEPEPARPGRVLVVADPRGDLPAARAEGDAVADLIDAAELRYLRGAEATGPAVRAALIAADSFHYAGHGHFAGRGGWGSALALADDSELTVGDILALPSVPAEVVLAGCETARGDEHAAEGLGLGQAFIAAGAQAVVAAARPVDDALTARLATALYTALAAGAGQPNPDHGPHDLARALGQAQMALRAQAPGDDGWQAFRLLVP